MARSIIIIASVLVIASLAINFDGISGYPVEERKQYMTATGENIGTIETICVNGTCKTVKAITSCKNGKCTSKTIETEEPKPSSNCGIPGKSAQCPNNTPYCWTGGKCSKNDEFDF